MCICEGYDAGDPNFYIHHEIIIPAFPLCTAWLDCPLKGGERGIMFSLIIFSVMFSLILLVVY